MFDRKTRLFSIICCLMLLGSIAVICCYFSATAQKAGKTYFHSDTLTAIPGLTPVQEAGTEVDFSTLFKDCLEYGEPLTYDDLRLPDADTIPYVAYDHVDPKFPLWIDTASNGKRDIVYDLYFYKGDLTWRIHSSDGKGVVNPDQYCLKLVKNFCRVEPYQYSKTNLYPNCPRCLFIYTLPDHPGKYCYSASRFIKRGDMSSSVIKDDVVEYEFYDPHVVDHMDGVLQKVILEIWVNDGKHRAVKYMHIAFDADQLRTMVK